MKKVTRPLSLPIHTRPKRVIPKKTKPFYKKFKRGIEVKIFFMIGILVVIALVNLLFKDEISIFFNTAPIISSIYLPIKSEIIYRSLLGLFYIGFFGSLFFLTIPVELSFFLFINEGHFPLWIVLILVYSATLGQLLNYAFGNLIGRKILRIVIDKKDQKTYHKKIRRLGMALVFIFNALPLPSQILSVVLGSIKYRFSRFLFIVMCAQLVKYTFMLVMYNNIFGII